MRGVPVDHEKKRNDKDLSFLLHALSRLRLAVFRFVCVFALEVPLVRKFRLTNVFWC